MGSIKKCDNPAAHPDQQHGSKRPSSNRRPPKPPLRVGYSSRLRLELNPPTHISTTNEMSSPVSIAALLAALREATPDELGALLCELDRGMPIWQARQAAAEATGTDAPPAPVPAKKARGRPKKATATASAASAATGDAGDLSDTASSTGSGRSRGRPRLSDEERAAREAQKAAAKEAAKAEKAAAREAAKAEKAAEKEAAKAQKAAEKEAAKAQKAAEKAASTKKLKSA